MVFFPENFTSKRPTPLKISRKVMTLRFCITWGRGAQNCPWESLGSNFQPKFQIIMIRPTKLYLGGCVHCQYHIPNHLGWLGCLGPWLERCPQFRKYQDSSGWQETVNKVSNEWRGLFMNFVPDLLLFNSCTLTRYVFQCFSMMFLGTWWHWKIQQWSSQTYDFSFFGANLQKLKW